MKIKEILVESFTSPFANLLAVANLVMVTILELCVLPEGFKMRVHSMNAPAFLASIGITGSTEMSLFLPPLVYLQWILVVAVAKFIRYHFRSELT